MKRLLKSLLREDKLKHVVVSAIMAVVLNLILPWWVAGLLTLAIGVGKEVYDKLSGKGHAEWEDLVADVVGIGVGLSIGLLTSCKPVEKVVYVPKVHTVTTEVVTHDTTIVVRIPENYVEVTSLDTISVITLPFAESRAVVSGGRLTHALGTHGELPTSVRIEERVVTVTDSIPYRVDVPVYIEKPLKWWQESLMWVGGIAILSVAVYIGIKIFRR
jgi:hypothetical protein